MLNLSLKELSQALERKKFTSVELTQFFLDRVKKHNSLLNAFITVDEDKSLAMAKKSDQLIQSGKKLILTGIPIAQKDIFCADGWKTTCGSKMLENFFSP